MYEDVKFLTDLRPYRNHKNLKSLEKVCIWLKDEFTKIGLEPVEQVWEAGGNHYKNIIASYKPGPNKKRLVIGGHYDVCGDQPGADDNASAVTGLLETARLFMANNPEIDYQVDFVAYCLEEPPYFGTDLMGSYIHAKSLYDSNVDVIGMICYEMIGYFSEEPNSQPYPSPELAQHYPSVGNFIVVFGIERCREFNARVFELMSHDAGIDIEQINFPDEHGIAGLSDQSSYWRFGYNALMINDTSFVRNPNYHQPSDTIETLNFEKMSEVVNSVYRACSQMLPICVVKIVGC